MSEREGAEFVTIAEAARRLEIDPRQVRRYLPRLAPTDKAADSQRTHKGHPVVLVRLSAVETLRDGQSAKEEAKDTFNGQDKEHTTDRTGHVRNVSDDALVEQLRAENGYLRAALERSQTLQLQTLTALNAEQQRARELEGQNAQLIAALPPPQTTPQEAPGAPQSGDRDESGESGHAQDCPPAARNPRRPWWQWWRRSKEGANRA